MTMTIFRVSACSDTLNEVELSVVVSALEVGLLHTDSKLSEAWLAGAPGLHSLPLDEIVLVDGSEDSADRALVRLPDRALLSWTRRVARHRLLRLIGSVGCATRLLEDGVVPVDVAESLLRLLDELANGHVNDAARTDLMDVMCEELNQLVRDEGALRARVGACVDLLTVRHMREASRRSTTEPDHSLPEKRSLEGGFLWPEGSLIRSDLAGDEVLELTFTSTGTADLAEAALRRANEIRLVPKGHRRPDELALCFVDLDVSAALERAGADGASVEWARSYGRDWTRAWNEAPSPAALFAMVAGSGMREDGISQETLNAIADEPGCGVPGDDILPRLRAAFDFDGHHQRALQHRGEDP